MLFSRFCCAFRLFGVFCVLGKNMLANRLQGKKYVIFLAE